MDAQGHDPAWIPVAHSLTNHKSLVEREVEQTVIRWSIFPPWRFWGRGRKTLAKSVTAYPNTLYLDLERHSHLSQLQDEAFLSLDKLVCIDEVQLRPDLRCCAP